jgi:hypothetical protein
MIIIMILILIMIMIMIMIIISVCRGLFFSIIFLTIDPLKVVFPYESMLYIVNKKIQIIYLCKIHLYTIYL